MNWVCAKPPVSSCNQPVPKSRLAFAAFESLVKTVFESTDGTNLIMNQRYRIYSPDLIELETLFGADKCNPHYEDGTFFQFFLSNQMGTLQCLPL